MVYTRKTMVEELVREMKWYICADEVKNLEGVFRPFNMDGRVEVKINQMVDGTTVIQTNNGSCVLNEGDSFLLTNEGHIRLIKGPSRYNESFEKIVAGTRLSVKKNLYYFDGLMHVSLNEIAYIPMRDDGSLISQQVIPTITKENRMIGREHKIVIIKEYRSKGLLPGWDIKHILVRSNAGPAEEQWLRQFVENNDLSRYPSGAFEVFTEKVRREQDALETEREIKLVSNHIELTDRIARKDFWELVRQVQGIRGPKFVTVGDRKFTISNGKIYRGRNIGGKTVDLKTAYENMMLPEILAAI